MAESTEALIAGFSRPQSTMTSSQPTLGKLDGHELQSPGAGPSSLPEDLPPASDAAVDEQDERDNRATRLRRLSKLRFQPNLVLVNNGSVARDHLASERTFLAYVRTSLAIAGTGVALVQLFTLSSNGSSGAISGANVGRFARPLGATTVILGLLVLLLGAARYFQTQACLMKGKFPAVRFSIAGIACVLGVLVIIIFGLIIGGGRKE